MKATTCLAVDLGASSGRVMAGWRRENGSIALDEVRRFENGGVERASTLCWDFDALMSEISAGLRDGIAHARDAGRPVRSIGIDSWAVDFGLLDESGTLIGPVVHYRDTRTQGQMERVFAQIPQREIFARTGIQFLPFNTIYQLAALQQQDPQQLARARHLLMIPDLVAWHLTGRVTSEYTNATTTQLFDARARAWSTEMIERLGLPTEIFAEPLQPGNVIGDLRPKLSREWGVENQRPDANATLAQDTLAETDSRESEHRVQVIAVATHDTASAVAAVPARPGENFAYLSCGTWSLLGTELDQPLLTEEAFAENFTNEGGAAGKIRFLKNIMGLWILQECRRHWQREMTRPESGDPADISASDSHAEPDLSWPHLEVLARDADTRLRASGSSVPIIDVDDPRFLPPGNMPARVRECAAAMGHSLPDSDIGAVVACVLRSLAARYRQVFEKIEELTVQRFDRLYVVGGGVQNRLLLEWTEEALGREVVPGPAEATALGNIGIQMIAAGELRDLADLRAAVR